MKQQFFKVHELQEEGFLDVLSRCGGVRAIKIQNAFSDFNYLVKGSKKGLKLLFVLWFIYLIKDFDENDLDDVLRHMMKVRNRS